MITCVFPTNFVDNCSYIDFVIIGYELKATIEWRVFLKMTRQVWFVCFVFLYLNTNMKSQRHSTCLSPRRCGCLRVSVCPLSFLSAVCLPVSLSVSVFLCLSPSLSRSVSQVGLSVRLSVCLRLSRSGLSRKSVCLSVCLCLPSPAHSQPLDQERRRHG